MGLLHEEVWDDPEDFWTEFLNEDAEEAEEVDQEWKSLDYYEMEAEDVRVDV
jgi:hypothetical protein